MSGFWILAGVQWCLENPMDGGALWAAVHGVAKSQIWLSDFTFTFHFHALEKEMATHSSVLAWRIPGMGEPGGLPSMGSHRVRHDWSDLAAAAAAAAVSVNKVTQFTKSWWNAHRMLVKTNISVVKIIIFSGIHSVSITPSSSPEVILD